MIGQLRQHEWNTEGSTGTAGERLVAVVWQQCIWINYCSKILYRSHRDVWCRFNRDFTKLKKPWWLVLNTDCEHLSMEMPQLNFPLHRFRYLHFMHLLEPNTNPIPVHLETCIMYSNRFMLLTLYGGDDCCHCWCPGSGLTLFKTNTYREWIISNFFYYLVWQS